MFGCDLLMPAPLREHLRGLDEPLGALRIFFEIHGNPFRNGVGGPSKRQPSASSA